VFYSAIFFFIIAQLFSSSAFAQTFYKGVDLSYVNQMEDHGAVYSEGGVAKDPYQIMHDHGANLVRIRLWHTPDWTDYSGTVNEYSNFQDVKKSIARAKAAGMQVLLDFHYSDTWADPSHQRRPEAWDDAKNLKALTDRLYNYTYRTLRDLDSVGLMPEMVQIGNETNGNMCLAEGESLEPVNFRRQAKLLNAGIQATKDAGAAGAFTPKTVIHIANPAHIMHWFTDAEQAGLTGYDIIGVNGHLN
jgi:arabinogalactan endo-1,4-beta-galactosidase